VTHLYITTPTADSFTPRSSSFHLTLLLNSLRLPPSLFFFFFNDTATTEIYTLSLHDALPISSPTTVVGTDCCKSDLTYGCAAPRSEEHTSELQSLTNLVCRLLLEKKKKKKKHDRTHKQKS